MADSVGNEARTRKIPWQDLHGRDEDLSSQVEEFVLFDIVVDVYSMIVDVDVVS